jgi:beta-glucosidase
MCALVGGSLLALPTVAGPTLVDPALVAAGTRQAELLPLHHVPPRPPGTTVPIGREQGGAGILGTRSADLRCPWAAPGALRHATPAQLAAEVVSRMTLRDELGLVDLAGVRGYENSTVGVPALCIPPLTLQDGPVGLSRGDTGVTQLPSSLAVAATFDTSAAYADGAVEGDEARRQGIDVVQGPMLNLDRVPEDGRAYETYGEDPVLASAMGVADIDGIQSHGVMADAKHLAGYAQESDRHGVDQLITDRQLEELYLAPFRAAVDQARVASVMCAYGEIDGAPACADALLYRSLRQWGFEGFVRSDMNAVHLPVPAFDAGMDAIKPAQGRALLQALSDHRLAEGRIDRAASSLLTEMFRFGMVADPPAGRTGAPVDSPSHAATDLAIAEESTVLLKDRGGVLPLDLSSLRSIAVIGTDAAGGAMSAGYGGARVTAPFVVEPVQALARLARPGALQYAPGGTGIGPTAPIPATSSTLDTAAASPLPGSAGHAVDATGSDASPPDGQADPLLPADGERPLYRSTGTIVPPSTGWYDLSLQSDCATWLLLGGRVLMASTARHQTFTWSTAVRLVGGHRYPVELLWRQVHDGDRPLLGWRNVSGELAAAVRLARLSQVAVVFAGDYSSEGMDRPDLALPGDENELIASVAAANPRTIVVLNTAGPVLMPWLSKVAAVVEAWYPGEEDGSAIAAVLSGRVDPGGRLPVTFPAGELAVPAGTLAEWPGIDSVVRFREGIDIGYRWDQANRVHPLFPFGFGLSYTSFQLSRLRVRESVDGGEQVAVRVTDTGRRSGSEVVEAYLGYPSAAAEPPWQLRAFTRVWLRPGASVTAVLDIPGSGFQCFRGGSWRTVGGEYHIGVGDSSAHLTLFAGVRR